MNRRSGYSLLEITVVLLLLGVLLGLTVPPFQRALAYAEARSARDVVAGEAARARALAAARGGADVVLDVNRRRVWIEARDTATAPRPLGDGRLRVWADGVAADTIRLRYDALGLGVLASRTLRFRAGVAEAGLTISSYGRVRSW